MYQRAPELSAQRIQPGRRAFQTVPVLLRRLAVCEVRRDRTILEEIRKVIAPLCDAYRQIQDQDTSGPVMNNSQTVYAGLTYGRNQLTENMADQGTNRGMLV